jgi:hypothetical protein
LDVLLRDAVAEELRERRGFYIQLLR